MIGLDRSADAKEESEEEGGETPLRRGKEKEEERDPRFYEQVEFQTYYDHALANIDKD